MALPQGLVASDKSIELFNKILSVAYSDIFSTLSTANYSTKQARAETLKQIQEINDRLAEELQNWTKITVPAFYEQGLFETTSGLYNRGSDVSLKGSFNRFHEEAIQVLASDTYNNIAEGMSGITRTAEKFVSMGAKETLVQEIAKGRIKGEGIKEITKNIKNVLQSEGINVMVDRAGNEWDLSRYGEMLARTKLTQAHNSGVVNTMVENGDDLVIVSNHFGSCILCAPYEGKILSVTGRNPAYPSLASAQLGGLYHPNCRHTMTPYNNKYLDQSVAWDTYKQKYVPFKELTIRKKDFPQSLTHEKYSKNVQNIISNEGRKSLKEKELEILKGNVQAVGKTFEKSFIIDPITGETLLAKVGGKRSVSFTPTEIKKFNNAILTHNHPSDAPFSFEDILTGVKTNTLEVRAVGNTYTHILRRPLDGWKEEQKDPKFVVGKWNDAITKVNKIPEYQELRLKLATDPQAKLKYNNKIMDEFSNLSGFSYQRIKTIQND